MFEHGDHHYFIMWETSCPEEAAGLQWWADNETSQVVDPVYKRIDGTHHRYTAILGPIASDTSQVNYKIDIMGTKTYRATRRGESEHTRLLVISDNQNGPDEFKQILKGIQRYYQGQRPDAILHVGDSVQNVHSENNWHRQFFQPMSKYAPGMLQTTPLIFVPGNHDHDKRRTPNSNRYTDMYHGINTTNQMESGNYHRFYHSVAVGSARVIVLDAECPSTEQTEFLRRELQSEAFRRARFRIVAVHIAPFIEYWDPDAWNNDGQRHWGEHVRKEYDPLFRKYNVDLVISGHQHNYQRSTVARDKDSSITYAIVGGAGGTLDLERVEDYHMYNVTYLDHHFVTLDIDHQRLIWKAWSPENKLIDQFYIFK